MMSRQMNVPQVQKILQDFEMESAKMDMKEEMMGDAIDGAMEEDGEEEEEAGDKILEEVLAEIGISVGQQVRFHAFPDFARHLANSRVPCPQLGDAPTSLPPTSLTEPGDRTAVAMGEGGQSSSSGGGEVDALQARLDKLRKD